MTFGDIRELIIKNSRRNIVCFIFLYLYRKIFRFVNDISVADLYGAYLLQRFHDKYKGKRCFIIGNGPSLKKTDLGLLRNEYTFGLNRIYLNFKNMGFKTNFLVTINELLISQCAREIDGLSLTKFISYRGRKYLKDNKNTNFIKTHGIPSFSKDLTQGVYEGGTVTYVAMQIAYYMGFSEVVLIGVDHNFQTKGVPNSEVYQKGDDPNHFDPKYFKGMRWQLPDLRTSELAYSLAKYSFENEGREIVDATVGGRLNIFRKVNYRQIFR